MTTTFQYAATLLLSSVCAFAHGEDLTTQEMFDALPAKGVFAGTSGETAIDRNMTRAEFVRVAALLTDLETVPSPPQEQNLTGTPLTS